ncbi:MAG TPA: prolyl oligopeptidase family serine peptidase [Candidatus Sulfotelmatobacter sp.]|nr:prolyl oligopeptidase family serine peptidase [Candidatus Sulfotelmatobacter sp.]
MPALFSDGRLRFNPGFKPIALVPFASFCALCDDEMIMGWLEQKIRTYEHMRWAQEPNRRVLPFAWGIEHIGGSAGDLEPRAYLERFVENVLSYSDRWYASTPAQDYRLADGVLTFTSEIASPWPENNRVYGQFFPARKAGPAVVVLAQWNARWEEQQDICRWLNRLGITAMKISLPYHDRRAIPGHPRGDHLVGPNIGLTLQANRQAVLDVRRALRWLERQGYNRLGILGTSIGSSVAFITACHEPALRAGAFLHVSRYFGDVVANGLTTMNVWESLQTQVSHDELQRYWSPISPYPYISKLHGSAKRILAITGRYDPTFWPEFTAAFFQAIRSDGVQFESMSLPCGHYSLGVTPFKHAAGYRFGTFLSQSLA